VFRPTWEKGQCLGAPKVKIEPAVYVLLVLLIEGMTWFCDALLLAYLVLQLVEAHRQVQVSEHLDEVEVQERKEREQDRFETSEGRQFRNKVCLNSVVRLTFIGHHQDFGRDDMRIVSSL
jgi:hypothetical protein